jgi:hypothetical protein
MGSEIRDFRPARFNPPTPLATRQFLRDIELILFATLSTCSTSRLMILDNPCVSLCKTQV